MKEFSHPGYETTLAGYVETRVAEKDGYYYVAEEMPRDFDDCFPDYCSPNAVEIRNNGWGDISLVEVEHCEFCSTREQTDPHLNALMDAWTDALSNEENEGDLDRGRIISDTLAPLDYAVIGSGYYGYEARQAGSFDLSSAKYLIFGGPEECPGLCFEIACEIVAHLNSRLWVVGSIPTDDVEDITELRVLDCSDHFGGVVWENVDSNGMSTPTAEELTNML